MSFKDDSVYHLKRVLQYNKLHSKRQNYKEFDKYKCIFVHISKNGGTSVAMSLLGRRIAHMTALDYQTLFGKKDFDDYFKFSFTRNPFVKLVSAYEFMQAGAYDPFNKVNAKNVAIIRRFKSLEAFVMYYLTPATAKAIRQFTPQYYYVCNSDFKLMVDYLGRLETVQKDYNFIRNKLGTGEPLKKMNVTKSQRLPIAQYYTSNAMIDKVISLYEKDFELFGYSKDLPAAL